jgi:hypothetical protein
MFSGLARLYVGLLSCSYDDDEGPGSDPLRGLGLSSLAVGAGDPSGSIFDMQLPIAGLQLLAGLLARSAQAMDWLGLQPDRRVPGCAEGND